MNRTSKQGLRRIVSHPWRSTPGARLIRPVLKGAADTLWEFWDAILIINLFLLSIFILPAFGAKALFLAYQGLAILIFFFLTRRLTRIFGDNLHFIRAQLGGRPKRPPNRYVRHLFDGYAKEFDSHLLEDLNYVAPNLVRDITRDITLLPGSVIADLGCGTGICGPLFEMSGAQIIGVDISAGMLGQAARKGCYDALIEADIIDYLRTQNRRFDLLVSADVLVYFGELDDLFSAAKGALKPGGRFAFTVEARDGDTWHLNKTGRYAHPRPYIERVLRAAGLETECVSVAGIRKNFDEWVEGDVWLVARPQADLGPQKGAG